MILFVQKISFEKLECAQFSFAYFFHKLTGFLKILIHEFLFSHFFYQFLSVGSKVLFINRWVPPKFSCFSSSQDQFFFLIFDFLFEKRHQLLFSVDWADLLVFTWAKFSVSCDRKLFHHDLVKFLFLCVWLYDIMFKHFFDGIDGCERGFTYAWDEVELFLWDWGILLMSEGFSSISTNW